MQFVTLIVVVAVLAVSLLRLFLVSLSPILAVCTPKKPSIQFISLSVFPLYFVVAAKIPSRKRNPQKKSAQSTKQTLKKQAKKSMVRKDEN